MEKIVGGMSEWSGVLKDFFRQIHDGSITLEEVKNLVNHNLPVFTPEDWEELYRDCFGEQYDFSQLAIPAQRSGFGWLVIVAQGMTPQKAYNACAELFPCWKYTDDLDKAVPEVSGDDCARWFRARIEANEELKNKSANDLKKECVPGITLPERLLLELMYFRKTGKHLDIENVTLCTGSRDSYGSIPIVRWRDGRRYVDWDGPGSADSGLRSRAAVSS